MVSEKSRPRIQVDVPAEFAARWLTEDFLTPTLKRPLLPLRLGETDLGLWQVVAINTVRAEGGYDVTTAIIRPMYE